MDLRILWPHAANKRRDYGLSEVLDSLVHDWVGDDEPECGRVIISMEASKLL